MRGVFVVNAYHPRERVGARMSFLPDTKRDLRNAQAAARCALEGHTWARRRKNNGTLEWVCVCCRQPQGGARV